MNIQRSKHTSEDTGQDGNCKMENKVKSGADQLFDMEDKKYLGL